MNDKRVLLVAQTPPPFHGQAIMQQYLVDARWDWCTKDLVRMNFSEQISDVGSFKTKKISQLFDLIRRVRKAAKTEVDVIYYPPGGPNRVPIYRDVIMLYFLKKRSRKIILHFHAGGIDQIFNKVSKLEAAIIKRAFRGVDAAIVLTDWLTKEVCWMQPKKIFVVGNGITDVFEKFRTDRSRPVVSFLFVGNLKKEKGIFTLLEAAAILKAEGASFCINFIGAFHSKEEELQFSAFIEQNNLRDNISYLGVKNGDEKWKVFAISDVLCLPTYETEAMPISILEGMMFEMPVITTNWRSIPDLISHEETGLLFEPHNSKQLAASMKTMLPDHAKRKAMGVKARQKFLENFTVARHLDNMENVFMQVINN